MTHTAESVGSRLLVDCTLAAAAGEATGISRVARQLAAACPAEGDRIPWEIGAVAAYRGIYRHHDVRNEHRRARTGVTARIRTSLRHVDEWMRDHCPHIERLLAKAVMAAGGIPPVGLPTASVVAQAPPVGFRRGDVLLLADATWMIPRWKPAVMKARDAGAFVVPLVHDLLPLTHPQFFAPLFSAQFERWLVDMIPLADLLVCNSHATADALHEYASNAGLASRLGPVGIVPLGAELPRASSDPRSQVIAAFNRSPRPVLMVGTIEPRKNHALVLDAFEQCWSAGRETPLVVIGRRGWQCESTLRRFDRLTAAGRPFTHIAEATDADLDHAYRHARCLLFPSIAEGFGLPIVEAMAHGLPVIASDIPVHREVGGRLATYIPFDDATHLASLLQALESGSIALATPEPGSIRLSTWGETVSSIHAQVQRLLHGS